MNICLKKTAQMLNLTIKYIFFYIFQFILMIEINKVLSTNSK